MSTRNRVGARASAIWAAAIAATLATTVSASAREDYCIDQQTGQLDRQRTNAYRQLEATENERYMRFIAGVWFHQTRNPGTGQTDNQYQKYEANGLWSYAGRVCSAQGFCTQYSGTGLFAIRANPNVKNGFAGQIIVSDSNRNHQCVGLIGQFLNRNQFRDPNGIVSQRVQ